MANVAPDLRSPLLPFVPAVHRPRLLPFFRMNARIRTPSDPGVTVTARHVGAAAVRALITSPTESQPLRPGVLWIHRGGYVVGSPRMEAVGTGRLARALGVPAMTRAFAAELAVHGIRVNSVSPGTTETPMSTAEFAAAPDPARERAENESTIPMGRFGQPGDIAEPLRSCCPTRPPTSPAPTWSSTEGAHRVSRSAPSAGHRLRRRCEWPWHGPTTGRRRSGPLRGARTRR